MRALFILFLLLPVVIYCQSPVWSNSYFIDSLKAKLSQPKNDSLQAQLLLDVAANYTASNLDSALYYGLQAVQLARRIGNKKIAVSVMGFIGDAYHSKGNLPKAIEISLDALAEAKGLPGNSPRIGPTYSTLGDIYTELGDFPRALFYYSKLLDFGDTITFAFGHFGRARVFEQMKKLDSALIELDESYKNFMAGTRIVKDYRVVPTWFNLRAKVYAQQGKIDLALKDNFRALNMTVKTRDSYYTSNSYNYIAGLYATLKLPDSSIYYAIRGLEEARNISYAGGILAASEILASQLEGINDSKAIKYFKLADSTRNQLYGAGNIQVMKDMIAQNDRRQQEADNAVAAYQDKLRINGLLAVAFVLVIVTILLIRNNRTRKKANSIIQKAYEDLKNTQAQLIQSEKMASLGELTAGIAHEIQNPLNFVNNFSELNKELLTEMEEAIQQRDFDEVTTIAKNIAINQEKVNLHGKRADGIVKGMLQHSRSSSGQKELTDINALCDEYLRLSYHGYRAKDKSFSAKLNTDFDSALPKINVVPQDIGRAVFNLINNAFYVVNEKSKFQNSGYEPQVVVATKNLRDKIEITVNDNGTGIPDSIKEKIFQPFFTTKPTGQGTGLGLSLSYDIVKAHGGTLEVSSTVGVGTNFTIKIPLV